MRFRSFQGRLLVLFLGLFVVVQAAAFFAIHEAIVRNARLQIDGALEVGAGVFEKLVEDRSRRLIEAARLLAGDYAFKSAYATREGETILSALENHQARIGADVMIVAALDGTVVADTLHPGQSGHPLSFAAEIDRAAAGGAAHVSTIVFIDGRPYRMVAVPLLTPLPDAWICSGFLLGEAFAAELQRLTLSHVSLLRRTPSGAWDLLATTQAAPLRGSLPAELARVSWHRDRSVSLRIGGEEFVSLLTPLGGGSAPVVAVLQRSMTEALAPFLRLRVFLVGLFTIGVILTLALGAVIARSVTRPVLELAAGARRVEAGDYSRQVHVPQQDEIGTLAASFNHMVQGLEEKRRVTDLLGKVVSPAIAGELLRRGIELGGEEREVTILFTDIRNFTALCETRAPQEVLSLLNTYLTRVSGVVEERGGVVDKYIGDAMMALFGAPLEQSDAAVRAVHTALALVPAVAGLNEEFRRSGLPTLASGIGINTGRVVAGNMGSNTRLNYTVIGDGVNLASRLEGLTKVYGVPILLSEATRAAAPGFHYREIDRVRVKGKARCVTIYEPLGPDREISPALAADVRTFHEALAAFRNRAWEGADSLLAGLQKATPESALYRLYRDRIAEFRVHPPPTDWDGAVSFSGK